MPMYLTLADFGSQVVDGWARKRIMQLAIEHASIKLATDNPAGFTALRLHLAANPAQRAVNPMLCFAFALLFTHSPALFPELCALSHPFSSVTLAYLMGSFV